jgi:hypothetical protein
LVALQIIVRASKGLEISQLELAVAAFSACAIFTYLILLPKPQGVRVSPRPIICESGSVAKAIELGSEGMLRELFLPGPYVKSKERKRVPNDTIHWQIETPSDLTTRQHYVYQAYFLGFMFGGIVFGSIHIAGWNLTFPTLIEQMLWRISSILLATLLPAVLLPFCLLLYSSHLVVFLSVNFLLLQIWGLVLGVLYIAARLLLMEIFRTLLYLPQGAYVSTWASNVPHFA